MDLDKMDEFIILSSSCGFLQEERKKIYNRLNNCSKERFFPFFHFNHIPHEQLEVKNRFSMNFTDANE